MANLTFKDTESPEFREKMKARDWDAFEFEGVWFPPITTPRILEQLKNFEVRGDDLILSTYPKCGTHWMAEVLQLIKVDGHVDKIVRELDKPQGGLEFGLPPDFLGSFQDLYAMTPSPRFIVTHLPANMLPPQVWTKKTKIVYVTRDPKDACTSFFRFVKANPLMEKLSWDANYKQFISEKAVWGNWFDATLGYWEHREDEHVFFVTFEEMKKDLRSVVTRLAEFLGCTVTAKGMERIVEHASVEGMKKSYAKIEEEHENGKMYTRAMGIMPFIQKGVSGGWKAQFTEEQAAEMDQMIKEKLKGTGLEVHYH